MLTKKRRLILDPLRESTRARVSFEWSIEKDNSNSLVETVTLRKGFPNMKRRSDPKYGFLGDIPVDRI